MDDEENERRTDEVGLDDFSLDVESE